MPSLRTIITWSVIAIIAYAFFKNPTAFGQLFHKAGNLIGQGGNAFSAFVGSLG